ncbi:hypothetical protein [Vibrio phage VpKK5]|uniref:hypothetical protein n=1 Tax=Vibrio phage VpKK5 TaxID=1538804 RepID=UPI0004F649F3|nr:hypothetical protein VC55_gp07 [Vibrio phage VpKK5]AIM40591.1 hypothetical protein [Vibrio phage VpKK5]
MDNLQRNTFLIPFTGTQAELDAIVEIQEIVTIEAWECNGQIAIFTPMFDIDPIREDIEQFAAKHFNTDQFIHIQ